jgi:hypothetical protein
MYPNGGYIKFSGAIKDIGIQNGEAVMDIFFKECL